MIPIKILRDIKSNTWRQQFVCKENPQLVSLTYFRKLDIGTNFIAHNHEGYWHGSWTVGGGYNAYDIRKITNIGRFLSNDYYYWEFVKESWSHGHYYRIETSKYGEVTSISDLNSFYRFYKIPTNEIPRELLPSTYDICKPILDKYSSDMTPEDDDMLIEKLLNGEITGHSVRSGVKNKWKCELIDKTLIRDVKLEIVI